jgi:hypothetical protein
VSGVFRTIDPHPPLHPASVSFFRTKGGSTHSPGCGKRGGGWGVTISEDARHWIGLLQYNPSMVSPISLTQVSKGGGKELGAEFSHCGQGERDLTQCIRQMSVMLSVRLMGGGGGVQAYITEQ